MKIGSCFSYFAILLGILSGCQSNSSTAQQKAPAAPLQTLEGTWSGVYMSYPKQTYIQFDLTPAATLNNRDQLTYAGTASFQSLADYRSKRPLVNDIGSVSADIRVTYDRVTQTISFKVGQSKQRDANGLIRRFGATSGVVDTVNHRIAGMHGRGGANLRTFFFMTRPEEFRPIASRYRSLSKRAVTNDLTKLVALRYSFEDATNWFRAASNEYPNTDFYRGIKHGPLEYTLLPLFADEHFPKYFNGNRFDDLSTIELRAISMKIAEKTNKTRKRDEQVLRVVDRMFDTFTGTGTAVETQHGVWAMRIIRAWIDQTERAINEQGIQIDAIDRIERHVTQLKRYYSVVWPSERERILQAAVRKQQQIADPVVGRLLEQALGTTASEQNVRSLLQWPQRNQRILKLASPEVGDQATREVNTLVNKQTAILLADEKAKLDRLPKGGEGLIQSNQWYKSFSYRFGYASRTSAYGETLRKLQILRRQQLQEIQSDALQVLAQLGNQRDVDTFLNKLMPVPGDRSSAAGSRIYGFAAKRKQEIHDRNVDQLLGLLGILGAIALDAHADELEQQGDVFWGGITSSIQNTLFSMSLEKLDPNLSDEEVSLITAAAGRALDGEFGNLSGITQDALMHRLATEYKKQGSNEHLMGLAAELAYEIHKTSEASKKRD